MRKNPLKTPMAPAQPDDSGSLQQDKEWCDTTNTGQEQPKSQIWHLWMESGLLPLLFSAGPLVSHSINFCSPILRCWFKVPLHLIQSASTVPQELVSSGGLSFISCRHFCSAGRHSLLFSSQLPVLHLGGMRPSCIQQTWPSHWRLLCLSLSQDRTAVQT